MKKIIKNWNFKNNIVKNDLNSHTPLLISSLSLSVNILSHTLLCGGALLLLASSPGISITILGQCVENAVSSR